MNSFRIGLVGYGAIGKVHAMAYRDLAFHYGLPANHIQIVGVATSRLETARSAAQEIGCDVYTDSVEELLDRTDMDVIDCCTPNYAHESAILAAARAGKHIYCEKPLSADLAQARRITAAVEQVGIKTQLAFNFRFFPAILRARQLIEDGFLGRIFSFRGRYLRSGYISASRPHTWRLNKAISGGGALYDLGSHLLDLVYFLLGDFDRIQATLETLIPERPVAAGAAEMARVDVDDLALLHLRLASGVLGTLEISRMGTGAINDLQLEISGDLGAIRFRAEDPTWLEVYDVRDPDTPSGGMRGFRKIEAAQRYAGAQAPDWTMTPNFLRTHAESQYQFLKAISEGRQPAPSFADGLRIQQVMESAQRAAEQGRWVSLSEGSSS